MADEIGNFKLPNDEKSLTGVVERGQHVKGFVIYCQLITEKIDNHAFCEKCPFHTIHMRTKIPIICTSGEKFTYEKKGQQIMMSAEGVESVEFPMQLEGEERILRVIQPEKKEGNMKKEIVIFTVELKGEYVRLYHELLESNPTYLVHQKLVEAGFHKLREMKLAGLL